MAEHVYNRIRFDAPDHWIDASTITLLAPEGPEDHRPNVVITRDLLDEGKEAGAYFKEHLVKMRKQLKAYKVHHERATKVGDRPAWFVEHSFRTPENVVARQQQVLVQDGDVIVTLTLTHVDDDFDSFRGAFDRLRESFRIG